MNENCKLIWTSEVDVDDWDGYFLEVNPNLDRDERYVAAAEINQSYLDDERTNLNIVLKHPIIAIADMGLGMDADRDTGSLNPETLRIVCKVRQMSFAGM